MSRKKAGVVGSFRKTLWATWASLVATVGGSLTAYFWGDIAKLLPGTAADGAKNSSAPFVAQVVGSLVSLKKSANTVKSEMLGCDVSEENDRIVVAEIEPGSPAALLGIIPGDIIVSIDQRPITSFEILNGSLARSRQFFSTVILVRRGDAILQGDVVRTNDEKLVVRRPLAQ
jgi:membrane-associated protease RseP (regulator of RpoE activity)